MGSQFEDTPCESGWTVFCLHLYSGSERELTVSHTSFVVTQFFPVHLFCGAEFVMLSKHVLSVGALDRRRGVFSFSRLHGWFLQADVVPSSLSCLVFVSSVCALQMGETLNVTVSTSVSEADSFDRQWSGIRALLGKVIHEE